jgi:hypothetical protein
MGFMVVFFVVFLKEVLFGVRVFFCFGLDSLMSVAINSSEAVLVSDEDDDDGLTDGKTTLRGTV